jgi:hypothetical protein
MNKFEQLIEFVINDEEQKARDLFHEIVVDKSRHIYEELMDEEEEVNEVEEIDEDDAMGRTDRYDETMGGDQADDLIDDVESEEQGLSMEADGDDHHDDMGGNEELEDRVVDLEDKLDELMAEFEALMDPDAGMDDETEMDIEVDSDDVETDDMDVEDEYNMDVEDETMEGLEEAINLKAAPAPVKSEEGNINKKSTVAANSGARGMDGKPVMSHSTDEKGRPAPGTQPVMSGEVQNAPAKSTVKMNPATKPHLAQATGVNTKSPY